MIKSLVVSLFLTLLIELTICIILGIRKKEDIKVVVCANVCTNPIVVFISNCILLLNNMIIYWIVVAILEITAVVIETIIYKKCLRYDKISPFAISAICNIISFSIGLIKYFLI